MLKYTAEHEWLKRDGDIATVGITVHAATSLGDLVFIELPEIGAKLKQGERAAVIESVKAASDVFAPLTGEVVAINEEITTDPAIVNQDPLGDGWFFKLKLDRPEDFDALLDEAQYKSLIGGRAS